jgi:drug/metabolite transporter (DMT)-like permease
MTRRGLVLFTAMAIIWGIPYLFIRVAVAEITPATLVFLRTSVAAVILVPLAIWRVDLRAVFVHWRWIAIFAAIEIAIPWVLLGSAEQHLSSSLTGLLIAATPLIGTVFALATGGGDRLSRTGVVGLFVGLAGVLAIVGADFAATNPVALLQVFTTAVCYAIGPAILARRLRGVPSLGIMSMSLAGCALLYAPVAAIQWPAVVPSTNVIISVLVLGTVCTAAAFIVFAALIAEIGPVRSTVITYINPAVAAILGVAVLSETFTPAMGLGLALVITGSVLATRRPTPPTAEAEADMVETGAGNRQAGPAEAH